MLGLNETKRNETIKMLFVDNLTKNEILSLSFCSLQLNSFKFSQNASYIDCNVAAVLALSEGVALSCDVPSLSPTQAVMKLRAAVGKWKVLFDKLSPRVDDQVGILRGLEEVCGEGGDEEGDGDGGKVWEGKLGGQGFMIMLRYCYEDLEVLSEDCIEAWAEKRRQGEGDEEALKLFNSASVQQFLEWLAESEEETDDDDDEESEEESD